jgi:hypothetical protein
MEMVWYLLYGTQTPGISYSDEHFKVNPAHFPFVEEQQYQQNYLPWVVSTIYERFCCGRNHDSYTYISNLTEVLP